MQTQYANLRASLIVADMGVADMGMADMVKVNVQRGLYICRW